MKELKAKSILLGLLAVMALLMSLASCEQNTLEDLTPDTEAQFTELEDRVPLIIGQWWHSHEEETNPTQEEIYRRDDYNFSSLAGRTGFTFEGSGDFTYHYTDAAGQPMTYDGKWRFLNSQVILFTFPLSFNSPISARLPRIKAISIGSDMLVIEPLDW